MKEFIDSVKALGEKMTGKEIEGAELVDVVDDIAEKYEGGGQGGSGSNYLMFMMDYYQVVGKHIDVDSLISLLEKYQINLDTELNPQGQTFIRIRLNDNSNYKSSIDFGYNVCSGGPDISIFNISLENLEVATTFRTILTANKEKIESFEITEDSINNMMSHDIQSDIIVNFLKCAYAGGKDHYLTIQEALSIFK